MISHNLYIFLNGIKDSLSLLETIYHSIKIKEIRNDFSKIFFLNMILYLIHNINLYFCNLSQSCIYFTYFLWTFPIILVSYVLTIGYFNKISVNYCKISYPRNNFKYNYNDKIQYFAHKIWYHIVFIIFIIQATLLSYIPYVGIIIDWYLTSLIYSFYCWEYFWGFQKIEHKIRFKIFESKLLYFLGFGSIFGIIKCYFNYLNSYFILSIIYPLESMRCIRVKLPKECIKDDGFSLFKIAFKISYFVITILRLYLIPSS